MEFYKHLLTFMDREEADLLIESLKNKEIKALRVNSLKVGEEINALIKNNALKPHKHVNGAFIYDKDELELGKNILFYSGAYYIQEPAAMLAETLLNIKEEDKVLDMCAAPGGKSFDALVDMNDRGLLVCNDIHSIRSKILSSNIEKYGFKNTIVLNDDSKRYKKYFNNFFDKIILDAPCSGSGMFRKNEKSREEWSIEKVKQCAEVQKSLIEDAYDMLKPGGLLLYSTCSFSIQENEDIIINFLNKHSDIDLIPIELNKLYNDSINISGGLRLYPFKYDGEGQCMFVLKKELKDFNEIKIKTLKACRVGKEITSFLESINFKYNKNEIVEFNQHYYLATFPLFDLKGIKFLRYGLELGELYNNRFIPAHALAMHYNIDKKNFIELTENEAIQYLQGLTISKEGNSGFKIASYKGLALGWVKHSNNVLKNHYPKGLRIKTEKVD